MSIPIFFACFVIGIIWFTYERKKATRETDAANARFWAREEAANNARNKDISGLPLLNPDPSLIPEYHGDVEAIKYARDEVMKIIPQPMCDLSEYTNTDLKLAFGVGNFTTVSDYDTNYTNFMRVLSNLARHLLENNEIEDAETVYELALLYGSVRGDDYIGLATAYLKHDKPEEIPKLMKRIEESDLPRKSTLLERLRNTLSTYQ